MNTRKWLALILVLSLLSIPVFGEDVTKIFGSVPKNGVNKVTLDNSMNDKEAVVVFKELNWPIPFAVYLAPHQAGTLNLPTESYQIYFTLGYDWNTGQKRFNSQPEYYMIAGIFNAGEAGTVHEEKTRPLNIVVGEYVDEEGVTQNLTEETDSAEWKWAESSIPLYSVLGSENTIIPIDASDYPLS